MKAADTYTIEKVGIPSLVLMERAALETVRVLKDRGVDFSDTLVVCGSGNNGGDGFAAARILKEYGFCAEVLFVGQERLERGMPDAEANCRTAGHFCVHRFS